MSFNKQINDGSINFIQMNWEICEKMSTKFLPSHTPVTLYVDQGHSNLYQNVEFGDTKF